MAGSYLEQFLDSIQTLPCDLVRNLTLIHDLDSKVNDFVVNAQNLSDNYVKNANDINSEDRKSCFNEIMRLMDKSQLYSEDKKELAHQIYNMVDKHIRRLDTELAKFDIELDSQGDDPKTPTENTGKEAKKKRPKSNLKDKSTPKLPIKHVLDPKERRRILENHLLNGLPRTPRLLDMEVDPNEPLYCICHQVSFGEMVGCDDADCQIEWFHFTCVGLTSKPKGKWYCPQCVSKRKSKQT